jgi:protein-S-isoprenylcysteine O-methyltransferase Ste14
MNIKYLSWHIDAELSKYAALRNAPILGGIQMNTRSNEIVGYILGGLFALILFPCAIYGISLVLDTIAFVRLYNNVYFGMSIAIACGIIGAFFGIWSILVQRSKGKGGPLQIGNIEISPKTRNLVISGPYRYTRNPMLFGACMMYLGFGILLNKYSAILSVIMFALFMLRVIVRMEEKRLVEDFGREYQEYRKRTSMFIPWVSRKNRK